MGSDGVGARRKARKDGCGKLKTIDGGAVAQLGARLDGIEEVVGSNPIGSTNFVFSFQPLTTTSGGTKGHYATFGASTMRTTFPCASRLLASMALP
jgi:hypothetical protein